MSRIKNVTANLSLLLFGLVVAFIILEIGLRILDPFAFRVRGNEFILPSNVEYITTNNFADKLDKTIIHSKNSLGFRGAELPGNADKFLTIIAVGGSTTESRFQSDDKEWVHLLGNSLNQHFSPLWINNAGLDGHSTFGHQILIRDLISPIKPKVILFLVGINEIGRDDLIMNEKKLKDEVQTDSAALFILCLANKSEALTLAVNVIRYLKAKNAGLTHNTQHNLLADIKRKFDVSEPERERILQEHQLLYLPGYTQRLQKLIQETQTTGSTPVLLTQPVLYGPAIDDVTKVNLGEIPISSSMDGALGWQVMELYNDVLRDMANKHNLLLIDLAANMPKSSALYYDNIHYTNEGASLVAENVFLILCPWLAEQYPEYTLKQCEPVDYEKTSTNRYGSPG